jgi:peptidoglycan hydrolase CwlO-like protein
MQLKSPILAALAMKAAADPFLKVKKLIQELIEKLVTEAAEEATKKGWCDTEMGKAESDRNSNMDKVIKLNAKLSGLEATKASLEEEIAALTAEIAELNDALTKTTKARSAEKAENMQTLDEAKEGLAATKDAYDVLASFYKSAGKAKVALVQVEASPVQAPGTTGGAYKGNQGKAGGILAMLEVIISDFERTIKVTTKSEKEANREFVQFERATKASIASKETQKSNDEFELKDTDAMITESMGDLDKHQKMLDDTLKTLEELKPSCVDTGMSYEDRVQKRKDEIEALKKAMCELDAEGVEDECK